jgi:hypothetical protein
MLDTMEERYRAIVDGKLETIEELTTQAQPTDD